MNLLSRKLNLNIPYAICISLKSEEKRRQQTIEECNKIGLPIKFKIVDLHPEGGVEGCKDSHKQVIQYAKNNNLEYILILEDDILFDIDMINVMKPIHIPKNFDMFYLGYHVNRGSRIGDQMLKIDSSLTTHAYIMKNTVYDLFLDYIDRKWDIPEFQDLNQFEKPFFTQQPPIRAIDMFYSKYIHHKRGQTYGVYPMIAYQRQEFSRIENANVDYRNLFVQKSNIIARNISSNLRNILVFGENEEYSQDTVIEFLESKEDIHDYDYIHVKPKKSDIIFNKEIRNVDWDVLYITDDEYLIRKQIIYRKKKDTWRIKYLYPGCSILPERNGKWLPEKPVICYYGKENSQINQLTSNYFVFYCSEEYKEIKQISDDIVHVPKHQYNHIPNHQVLLKNDITFFIDHAIRKPNIILWMTQELFDYEWKCDWWHEQGTYTVPFEGKAFFTNMARYVVTILFDTKEICDKFCEKYEVVYNPKNMMILEGGKHNFEIEETTQPVPWKIVAQTNSKDFMKYINLYKTLKKHLPKFTMDLYGCSKSNKKRFRNINISGIKALKGEIDWKKGDVFMMLEDNEDLYWKAKMSSCFILSEKRYSYMNDDDIILETNVPKSINREELKRNSFDYAFKQKGSNKLIEFFIRN